ncbi:MAG: hypothetical protein JNJ47_00040 [Alphaproteobacteria bacterium]|nr:hypothetical protein [Alphaproteobacteria bacterium]
MLQFSKSDHPGIEEAYQTHYISASLSEKKQEKLKEKLEKSPDLVVFSILKPTQCSQCQEELEKGRLLYVEGEQSLCLNCAGFGNLAFLPSRDASLTRAAKKQSKVWLVVVRFSRTRKRYERQGLLVEEEALQKAEKELSLKRKEA